MQMIWVEGGSFMMGCTSEQGEDCDKDEKNVHRVTLDGFYIGMLEVTQSQWEKVMGTTLSQQKTKSGNSYTYGVGPDYPMYYVSWDEAMAFCRKLSRQTGRKYTLPTEAQWEYAARGGVKSERTKYAGSNVADVVAWYESNSENSTHRCGTKRANVLGIYDMSGNVWEWCHDWYSDTYVYSTNNPSGPSSGFERVLRGGGWSINANYCRVASRYDQLPDDRGNIIGFRVVCLP
jgi:formylglycine-generating enzyme required for sulfatase activity